MSIKIGNLQKISDRVSPGKYLFQDLHLDIKKNGNFSKTLNEELSQNDIAVDYNELAIKNSLRNLFNTRPGQRFLFPLYGLDMYQYLFEAITETNARLIGQNIVRSIRQYEPRVQVLKCVVDMKPDDNMYEITLILSIPALNTTFNIYTDLDLAQQSFIFLETSRNR